jgi:hypothetical protein
VITASLVQMKHNSTIVCATVLLLFGCQDESDPSSNDGIYTSTKGIELRFIRREGAINALKQVFSDEMGDIEFTSVEPTSITIHTNNNALLDRASTLIHEIDQPSCGPPTKWVPLATLDLERAAAHLKGQIPDESFQAIPEPRTKRMFLMGTRQNLDVATDILQKMEAEQNAPGQHATQPLSK